MQGYVTSEPFAVEKAAGFKPNVLLLADYGFNTYSTLIETRRDIVEKKPDLVQRFVDASMVGWYNYIYRDNSAGNAMIKKLNPEMTDESAGLFRRQDEGIRHRRFRRQRCKNGIGAMSDERYTSFFDKMVKAGVVKRDLDLPQVLHAAFRQQGRRCRAAPRQAVTQGPCHRRQNFVRGRGRPDGPGRQPARRDEDL